MPKLTHPRRRLLLRVFDCGFDRESWHGANLMSSIRGVGAKLASRRIGNRKTIWEQLLHAAYWKHVVLIKLEDRTPFPWRAVSWPAQPGSGDCTDARWKGDQEKLRQVHARLRKAIVDLAPTKLSEKAAWLIHGVAAHDVYHAGQIKLLRRLHAQRPAVRKVPST